MINTYPLLRPLLFSMDPEAAHDFSFTQLDRLERCGLLSRFIGEPLIKPVHVCGIAFRNPVSCACAMWCPMCAWTRCAEARPTSV